jgi:hypothetical protein
VALTCSVGQLRGVVPASLDGLLSVGPLEPNFLGNGQVRSVVIDAAHRRISESTAPGEHVRSFVEYRYQGGFRSALEDVSSDDEAYEGSVVRLRPALRAVVQA